MPRKLISYNVNGIRAAHRKGLLDWMSEVDPDVVCIQETKAQPGDVSEGLFAPDGYKGYWHSAEKKGYSGVAIWTKEEPLHVEVGCGIEEYDREGRVLREIRGGFAGWRHVEQPQRIDDQRDCAGRGAPGRNRVPKWGSGE